MGHRAVSMVFASVFLLLMGCAPIKLKFPEPSPGFTPARRYSIAYDALWNQVRRALDAERIIIANADKTDGRLTTDYVAGPSGQSFGTIMMTRYKFNISLKRDNATTTSLNIFATLESAGTTVIGEGGSVPWHDISRENPPPVAQLANWLYERIEKTPK